MANDQWPQRKITVFLLCLFAFLTNQAFSTQMLYWVDIGSEKIQRSNLDGTNVEDVIVNYGNPYDIAIDSVNNKLYWTNSNSTIYRSNLDGSNIEIVITGIVSPRGLSIDVDDEKLYWTDISYDQIGRCDLDGTDRQILVNGAMGALDIDLDLKNQCMYWTEEYTGKVMRANIDGSVITDIYQDNPLTFGMDIDSYNDKLYWVSEGYRGSGIRCSNLDGTDIYDVYTADYISDVLIDPSNDMIYWNEAYMIKSAYLDGSGIQTLVTLSPIYSGISSLEFGPVPEPVTMLMLSSGFLFVLRKRKNQYLHL